MSPTERSLARIYDALRKRKQRAWLPWSQDRAYQRGMNDALDAVQAEFDKPIDWGKPT